MSEAAANTLTKQERLCGKTGISRLMSGGRWGSVPGFKYCCLKNTGEEVNRIVVSVPKRLFKRAVKRNLLKRRIRESWRTMKGTLTAEGGTDLLILYNTPEILTSDRIREAVQAIIAQING